MTTSTESNMADARTAEGTGEPDPLAGEDPYGGAVLFDSAEFDSTEFDGVDMGDDLAPVKFDSVPVEVDEADGAEVGRTRAEQSGADITGPTSDVAGDAGWTAGDAGQNADPEDLASDDVTNDGVTNDDAADSEADSDDVSSDDVEESTLIGVRTRITSPRAGMFDLESAHVDRDAPVDPDGDVAGSDLNIVVTRGRRRESVPSTAGDGSGHDVAEELEWNYPVIIATAVAAVVLIIVILLLVL